MALMQKNIQATGMVVMTVAEHKVIDRGQINPEMLGIRQ